MGRASPIFVSLIALGCAGCADPAAPERRHDAGTVPATASSGEGSDTVAPVPPSLVLGDGEIVHEPLVSGEEITVWRGGQGGYHVIASGQVAGLGSVISFLTWLELADGTRVAETDPEVTMWTLLGDYDDAADSGWFAGVETLLLDWEAPAVCGLQGEASRLCGSVESFDGTRSVEGCVDVVADLDGVARSFLDCTP